jgi:PAS domain S-box-containing protein
MARQALPSLRAEARVTAVKASRLAEPVARDPELDRLTRMAARILKVPLAAVSIIDEREARFRSSVGVPETFAHGVKVPLSHSICKYVVSTRRALIVRDARRHHWLASNPAIEEMGMVAYAGVPIRADGQVVGAFCVSSPEPRQWTPEEIQLIRDFAALVEEEITLRRVRERAISRVADDPAAARVALEGLLATEARYEALVEQSIVGICIVQDGRFRYVNRRFAEVFGYTQEEILGLESVLELAAPEARELVAENIRKRIQGELSTLRYSFQGLRKDGSRIDVEVHGTRAEFEGRAAVVSVLLDVSERLTMERALRASEERLRLVVEGAHDAFVAVDMKGILVGWNTEAERIFGWSHDEAVGRPMAETILPHRYRRAHERAMKRFRNTGDLSLLSRRMELKALHRKGHEFPVEVSVTVVPEDGSHLFCAFLHDVSHRKQAEQALRRNEERFRWLVENTWDIIQVLGEDEVIRYVSPSSQQVLGYPADEVVGHRFEELVHPEDLAIARDALGATVGDPTVPGVFDLRIRHRDGSWRIVEVRGRVLTDPEGRPTTLINMHDLSARKAAEAEVQRKNTVIELMRAVAVAANEASSPESVMRTALDLVCEHTGWPIGHAYSVNGAGDLVSTDIWHLDAPTRWAAFRAVTEEGRFLQQGGLPCRVLSSREPYWMANASRDPAFIRAGQSEPAVGAGFAVPVLASGEVVAVLEFFTDHPIDANPSVLALVTDIAAQLGRVFERVRAEEALRASDERFQLVSRATNDTIWEWDLTAGRLIWSDIASRVLRYRAEEMGSSIDWWYERIHPEDRERVIGGLHGVMAGTGDTWSCEYRFLRGDGQYATMLDRVWVVRNERAAAVRVIGCMLDVSERRQAEEAQRLLGQATGVLASSLEPERSLASLARLLVPELCDFCFIDLVEDDRLRRVGLAHSSPVLEAVLAGGADRPIQEEAPDGLVGRVLRSVEPVLITEWQPLRSGRRARDAGEPEWLTRLEPVSLMVLPLTAREELLGVLVMATSDSARRFGPKDLLLGEELARRCTLSLENSRLYRQAREAVRAREEILGVVTHDLRNPLHTIQLATSMLHDANQERRANNVKWLEIINRSADGMEHMIEDLLDISSIDAGRFAIAPADHDVSSMILTVCDTFQPLATRQSIELDCRIEPELSTVWIDSHQIHRVFSNLIGNALKFTPAGGTILLHAERAENEVRFSVSDSGPGIPPTDLPHVFDRYWQARKGDRRGAGLGLTIARGIVEQHRGRIWVESEPGKGATFCFTVPLAGD